MAPALVGVFHQQINFVYYHGRAHKRTLEKVNAYKSRTVNAVEVVGEDANTYLRRESPALVGVFHQQVNFVYYHGRAHKRTLEKVNAYKSRTVNAVEVVGEDTNTYHRSEAPEERNIHNNNMMIKTKAPEERHKMDTKHHHAEKPA